MAVDQLGHVLVPGHDHHLVAHAARLLGQSADHIVRFDTLFAQQRQAQRLDHVQQRLDLRTHIVGHGRAVGLVTLEKIVAKSRSRRIENHGDMAAGLFADQLAQHVEHAVDRTRRPAVACGERRQRMEGPIQIRRAVNQDQLLAHRVRAAGVAVVEAEVAGAACFCGRYRGPDCPQALHRAMPALSVSPAAV